MDLASELGSDAAWRYTPSECSRAAAIIDRLADRLTGTDVDARSLADHARAGHVADALGRAIDQLAQVGGRAPAADLRTARALLYLDPLEVEYWWERPWWQQLCSDPHAFTQFTIEDAPWLWLRNHGMGGVWVGGAAGGADDYVEVDLLGLSPPVADQLDRWLVTALSMSAETWVATGDSLSRSISQEHPHLDVRWHPARGRL